MNLFRRLFVTTAFLILFTVAAFADEDYTVELLYITSDHGVEGQVDTHFDQRLFELGRSTSERLFGDEPMRRYGVLFAKQLWGEDLFAEYGGFVDANGTIVGHSDLGDIHVRQDCAGVFAIGGFRVWRVAAGVGPYGVLCESNVHSWLPYGPDDLREFHDTYRDFSTGLQAKASIDITDNINLGCRWFFHYGDKDTGGTDRVLGCLVGAHF